MSYFGMYILARLDCWSEGSQNLGIIILVIAAMLSVFTLIVGGIELYQDNESVKRLAKVVKLKMLFIISAVLLGISALLPTTKQAAFIYIAPQIIENGAVKDTVKNIPELTKLGTDYLKELLKEKINEQ